METPAVCGTRGSPDDLEAVALTNNQRLLCFRESDPDSALEIGPIRGTEGGERIVGIDFRPRDGQLYGLGDASGIYRIDPVSGAAERISSMALTDGARMPVELDGRAFAVDFDPVEDRLRVLSDRGQDLIVDVRNGRTQVDPPLRAVDAPNAAARGVIAAAHTNNDAQAATGTVLYAIDARRGQLNLVAPAGSGMLSFVGRLGGNVGQLGGFDIHARLEDGRVKAQRALAVLPRGGGSRVFAVDLNTGELEERSRFRGPRIIGLAIPLSQGSAE